MSTPLADAIIAGARECLGTPFRHQGKLVGRGLDCAGVAIHAARQAGLDVIVVDGYGRHPADGSLEQALAEQTCLQPVSLDDRQPGDLLLMRFSADPQHLAIYTGESIIHAYQAAGKCVEHRLSDVWAARIVAVYRFVGDVP